VTDLKFVTSVSKAVTGAETVLFVAPERQLKKGWLGKATDAPWVRFLKRAAAETEAGPVGKLVAAQNPDKGPQRVLLGVLPDEVSRHNSPARVVAADNVMKAAEIGTGTTAVVLCLEDDSHAMPLVRAVARMLPEYSHCSGETKKQTVRIVAVDTAGKAKRIAPAAQHVAHFGRWAARLVDAPPAEMHTTDFVREARKAARGIKGLKVTVISGDQVLAQGMGGLHAVGRTAIHPPKLLLLHYKPTKARRKVALIGKGIIYDTGGLSLKSPAGMYGMKFDMGGAAGMVGAALALAASGSKDEVICAAALAENAIGPNAYRPDDILEMHSGKTVEINNTDAEGRLVLADAASYVARKFKPDVLIDMATLTGAQLVSTGHRHASIVSNRAGLEAAAMAAGRASGDMAHAMPFAPELYQAELRSKVADMRNSVADRMNAQVSCAAQFIYSHIADLDLPWLHVDMAGPASHGDRGTGYGVAFTAALLDSLTKGDLAD
jgi:probable aminopeptidase NPEPL1